MSENPIGLPTPQNSLDASNKSILDIISQQQQIDKVKALTALLELKELDISIVGEAMKVLNIELITEYTGKDVTKFMVKNETTRQLIRKVLHYNNINDEKIIGYMDTQIMLKMISHRRKRATEFINGLKNEVAGAEVIPQNTRKKRFFGTV